MSAKCKDKQLCCFTNKEVNQMGATSGLCAMKYGSGQIPRGGVRRGVLFNCACVAAAASVLHLYAILEAESRQNQTGIGFVAL